MKQTELNILEKLESLDRKIDKEERDLVFMNKQIGNKVSKISLLKEERKKMSEVYNDLKQNIE